MLSLVLSLVMPPDLAGHCQRCPGSFCRGNCDGGFSGESTGVDNTANGDAENQNSDDAETGDDDAQSEEQSKTSPRQKIMKRWTLALSCQPRRLWESEEATTDINNAEDLRAKLLSVGENQAASFKLTADIDYAGEITLNSGIKITLNLNGCKITHSGDNSNRPLFNIANSATLTLKILAKGRIKSRFRMAIIMGESPRWSTTPASGIPTKLTYYVTESTPNGTGQPRLSVGTRSASTVPSWVPLPAPR